MIALSQYQQAATYIAAALPYGVPDVAVVLGVLGEVDGSVVINTRSHRIKMAPAAKRASTAKRYCTAFGGGQRFFLSVK
jgi:hypothetical protein